MMAIPAGNENAKHRGADASWPDATDQLAISAIRTLAMDAVEAAQSGHAGLPMGMAPVAYTLWRRHLRYDVRNPNWVNRDRFVLSAGHGCLLLYALLHLAGVEALDANGARRAAVTLDDIKRFRQLGSACPGHPEYDYTPGVEATTGPLGQGAGDSVGMAIAQRWLGQRFNRPGFALFDYNVYALVSDGDLMEGVASETASLAGHLKLSNLCWIYDDNRVTIEGPTDLAFSEDVAMRFRSYGWSTIDVADANDCEAMSRAFDAFARTSDRPTLIRVRSIIGYGSPHRQGTAKIHSDPLGAEEVALTKRAYDWPEDRQFFVPDAVRERFDRTLGERGHSLHEEWRARFLAYGNAFPELRNALRQLESGEPPAGWDRDIPSFPADANGVASRDAFGKVLNAIGPHWPWLVGGAADLAPSTKTRLAFDGAGDLQASNPGGRNMHFGVREHAMGAVANGLALSHLRPYAGTFLVFSDYMRPSMRLAAMMDLPVVFVFTHDSIGLGQDGPTHQPIEHLAALRAMPGMSVVRPCDANETAEACRIAFARNDGPTSLVLSRQRLPTLDRTIYKPASGLARGAYVLADGGDGVPEIILIGTGSEVALCVAAFERLRSEGVKARVVSMPSWDVFEAQDISYREEVLPREVDARVAVEAGAALGWDRYAGASGEILAMRTFGASAPIAALEGAFGFTPEHVYQAARRQLTKPDHTRARP
jgi:transketolase